MAKTFTRIYWNEKLISDADLAKSLGVGTCAINNMKNKRKKLLLKLGLAYKRMLDEKHGSEFIKLENLQGSKPRKNLYFAKKPLTN